MSHVIFCVHYALFNAAHNHNFMTIPFPVSISISEFGYFVLSTVSNWFKVIFMRYISSILQSFGFDAVTNVFSFCLNLFGSGIGKTLLGTCPIGLAWSLLLSFRLVTLALAQISLHGLFGF
jgi:hypothetical protein